MGLKEVLSRRHKIARLPVPLSKIMAGYYFAYAVHTLVAQMYCFVLNGATTAVENGAVFWGIALFVLYHLRQTVCQAIAVWVETFSARLNENANIDVAERSMEAMAKVSGKVFWEGEYLSNSVLLTSIGRYIERYRLVWGALIRFAISSVIFVTTIVGMIATAVSQFQNLWLFTITTIVAIILNFVIAYKRTKVSRSLYEQIKTLVRKRDEQRNACVNQKHVSHTHSTFMLNRYVQTMREISMRQIKDALKGGFMDIGSSAVSAAAIIVIIADAVIAVGFSNVDGVTFMKIISLATIFSSILHEIQYKIAEYQHIISKNSELSEEASLFDEIMRVHAMQKEEEEVASVELKPFEFAYEGGSFTLKNERKLSFRNGEMVLLKGDSGAGKSTLLKVLCGDVDLGNNPKIRNIKYSSEGALGCESLLDEITFGDIHREKLLYILKGVQIYDLLLQQAEGKDVLEYLAGLKGGMSTGMQDRLMLARTLYNLDDCSLVIIDEPIGGVDIETGRKIISFIREYAARKMNKVVLVTTHQYHEVKEQFDRIVDVERKGCVSRIS